MEEHIAWIEEAKIKNICKCRRSHLDFPLNFEGYLQMFAFYTEDTDRVEVLCIEDLPDFANFCPKKHSEKEL